MSYIQFVNELMYALRCFSCVPHGVHNQAGTSRSVPAGKNPGDARHLVLVDDDSAPLIHFDPFQITARRKWDRVETVSDQDHIRPKGKLGAFDRPWLTATATVGLA